MSLFIEQINFTYLDHTFCIIYFALVWAFLFECHSKSVFGSELFGAPFEMTHLVAKI